LYRYTAGDDVPAQLADTILTTFVAKHAKHLDAPGGPPAGKSLKFTSVGLCTLNSFDP
jgi:hypothetical protein